MPPQYENLQCPQCEGTYFVELVYVKHKPGSGLVADKAGWLCINCQIRVDMVAMLREAQLRVKREELKALEAELGGEDAPGSAVSVRPEREC